MSTPVQTKYVWEFEAPHSGFTDIRATIETDGEGFARVRLDWSGEHGAKRHYFLHGLNATRFIDTVRRLMANESDACSDAYVLGCIHHWGL